MRKIPDSGVKKSAFGLLFHEYIAFQGTPENAGIDVLVVNVFMPEAGWKLLFENRCFWELLTGIGGFPDKVRNVDCDVFGVA